MYHFNMSSVLSGGNLAIANKTGSSMKVFITGTEVDDPSSFEVYFVQKLRNTDDSDGGKGKKNGRGDKDDDDDDDVMGVVMYSIGGAVATVMVLSGLFVGYRRFNAQKYGHGNVAPMTIEVRPDPNDPGGYQIRQSSRNLGTVDGEDVEAPWVPIPVPSSDGPNRRRSSSVTLRQDTGRKGKGKSVQVEMNFLHGSVNQQQPAEPQLAKPDPQEPTWAVLLSDDDQGGDHLALPPVAVAEPASGTSSNSAFAPSATELKD